MHLITIRDQVCNVMASLTKTLVSPDIVLQKLEAITACSSWTKACTATTWSSIVHWTLFVCCRIASRMYTGHPSGTPVLWWCSEQMNGSVLHRMQWCCSIPEPAIQWTTAKCTYSARQLDLLVQGPKLLYSLLTLFFTRLWWPWWSPWCSSPGNS